MKTSPTRILLITSFLTIYAEAMSQFQFLGNVTNYAREEHGVLLSCGEDLVRVAFLFPDVARLTLARQGQWDDGPQYALAADNWPGAPFELEESATHVRLKTNAMEVRIQRSPCRFVFYDAQGNLLNQDEAAFGMAWDGNEVAVFKSLLEGERFFGLGEKAGGLDRRNRELIMWNSDIPSYSDTQDPLYQSHPFFIGLREGRGYGIFFNNTHRSYFNMGAGNHRLYYFRADSGPLDYFFFAGPSVKQIISRYSELVGRMPLPPEWALGFQQCRWSYFPESEVRTLAQTFRDKRIPADVIYLDIHYMDGYRCFTFDSERFPNPEKLLSDLRAMGFKVVTIVDPGIKVDSGYAVYESGLASDHFIKFPDGRPFIADVWPGPSHFANYTKPETRQWWGDLHEDFLNKGVAGIWNDMNEPAMWGREAPLLVEFDEQGKKTSIKKIHNVFGHLMAQATYEGLRSLRPNERPFVLTRAGFSGTQRYAASWTGDNVSSFEHLEIAIRMCQSMGLSGIPFVGADVGGFMGSPSPELFVRWTQVGAFTPFFRAHTHYGSQDQEPWSYGETAEDINRRYIELRYRLLPYNYSAFHQAAQTGLPIMRPLLLEFPDDPEVFHGHNHTTYLWGEDILVAPVTRPGQDLRKVYLPKGTWHDFWENKTYDGGTYIHVDAPLDKLPLFVRAGAVIPMRDVQQFIGERPAEHVELHLYPGAERTSSLYEDDGKTFEYEQGQFCRTQYALHQEDNQIVLSISKREGSFTPARKEYLVILHGQSKAPQSVTVDGKKLTPKEFSHDPNAGTISFILKDNGEKRETMFRW